MHIADSRKPRGLGVLPLQHPDFDSPPDGGPKFDVDLRGCILAIRVKGRDDYKKKGLGRWIVEDGSLGDLHGGQFFEAESAAKRPIGMWRFATPVVVQEPKNSAVATASPGAVDSCAVLPGFNVLPVFAEEYKVDDRFKRITPERPKRNGKEMWPKFPVDFFGITLSANRENRQVDLFMSGDPRLVAVQRKGDAAMGSLVCDMGDGFKIDLDRMARLQSMMAVIVDPQQCGKPYGFNVIGWNIGPTGCEDTRGGYVVERRAMSGGNPTPGGGGGGVGPNDVPTLDVEAILKAKLAGLGNRPDGGIVAPDAAEAIQNSLNLLRGARGGGPGGGAPAPSVGSMPQASKSPGVIALISHFDSGHSDVGSQSDKHSHGTDKDGRPINALHLSTNALFRRDDFYDAPLEFGGNYVDPIHGDYLMPVYLRYDSRPSHPFTCGPRKGLWRWESECCFHQVDQPPVRIPPARPPEWVATGPSGPPGGGGGDGDGGGGGDNGVPTTGSPNLNAVTTRTGRPNGLPTVKQWAMGTVDRYTATEIPMGMPAFLFRPQDLTPGAVDLRGKIPAADRARFGPYVNATTPVTGRLEAFGFLKGGHWSYAQKPRQGRFPGGTAAGGIALLPPELDMMDYLSNFTRNGFTPSTTYAVAVPSTYWAGGLPDPTTGAIKTGYRWGVDTSGNLKFDNVTSAGVATNVLKITQGDGVIIAGRVADGAPSYTLVGVAFISLTSSPTTGLVEQTLKGATFPAGYFTDTANETSRGIRIKAWGTSLANGNTKTLRLYFGGTIIAINDITPSPNGDSWELDAIVLENGSNSQRAVGEGQVGYQTQSKQVTTPAETTSGTIIVKVTGETPSNTGDVTCVGMIIEVLN